MNNDIIHKLEDIAIKMNNQHDRLERLLFGVELNLITCNKIEPEKNNIHKTISLNKKQILWKCNMIRYTILVKIGGFFNLKTEFVGITKT